MVHVQSKSGLTITSHTTQNEFLSILLKNRGLKTNEITEFFNPPHPRSLPVTDFGIDGKQLSKAIVTIHQAINGHKNILIYGDYDVDGITSTALLWHALNAQKAKVTPFVPDRHRDGYGFKYTSLIAFEQEKNIRFDLVITVDNGIVAHRDLSQLVEEKRQIIVIDHHLPDSQLDKSIIVIHSTSVSGSILAWLVAKEFEPTVDIGLAALGAVADCVPLIKANRSIVVHGLQSLRVNPNLGIKKVLEISHRRQDTLSATDLGFIIGPRINAVGRLSNPTDALRLLCSTSLAQATKYASILEDYNKDRQLLQSDHLAEAEKGVKKHQDKIIIFASKNFSAGIIGLVAGRLLEKYYVPTIIMSIEDGFAKGSCRSIPQVNIIEELRKLSPLFEDLGGHASAAGFTIKTKNIPRFKKKFTHQINTLLAKVDLSPSILVDAQMTLSATTIRNCQLISKLEPFGIGNPQPLFLFKGARIASKRLLGSNGDHLKLTLDDPNTPYPENIPASAIAFKKGELDKILKIGEIVDIIASLEINEWQGNHSAQLIIKEIIY